MLADFHVLPEAMNALVHVDHEFVEMRRGVSLYRACLEEQIHQHGLAAADFAVDVESLQRRLLFVARRKQPAERRRFARETMLDDPRFQPCQHIDDGKLGCIALNCAAATLAAYRAVIDSP